MASAEEAKQDKLSAADDDLVALYVEDTRQEERIVRIFLAADQEPPRRERTEKIGFTPAEVTLMMKWPRPQDSDEDFTHTPAKVA